MKKYGVENPSQNIIIKNKKIETSLKNWGVEYPSQLMEFKKIKEETSIKNWGTKSPLQNDEIKYKIRQTCLKNWGVEYPMQNKDIMEKQIKSSYLKKEYILPSNKIIEMQGYENLALDELIINEKIDESDIITGCKNVPVIWYNDETGKKHRHYVDIFILSQNRCIEVKSTWTAKKHEHNIFLKQNAAKELGYKYEIWVYNNKNDKIYCYE